MITGTGDGDQHRFFQFAMGSACELEYELELSRDLRYVSEPRWKFIVTRVVHVKRMLSRLMGPRRADGGRLKADSGGRRTA